VIFENGDRVVTPDFGPGVVVADHGPVGHVYVLVGAGSNPVPYRPEELERR
jgi:hypothetical protein